MNLSKLHWGHYIAIFYVVFVMIVITALVASFGVDRSLVVDDYYAKDIAYQEHYDKKQNQLQDGDCKIVHLDASNTLNISLENGERISGSVKFYRPSDKSLDFIVPITNKFFSLNTSDIASGKWVVQVDWSADGKDYFKEQMIFI